MNKNVEIYCCYAQEDFKYLQLLKAQLGPFLQKDSILFWDDTDISPGTVWKDDVTKHLEMASVVLLLVSADFLNSEYYSSKEMTKVLQRHEEGSVRVIPIIIRPVEWEETSLRTFWVLPIGAKPASLWENADQVFLDIARGIAKVVNEHLKKLYPPETDGAIESFLNHDVAEQLEQIIQNLKALREQITKLVRLEGLKDFNLERGENQYNKLYGDAMVFLTIYLPECVSDNSEGFVEMVHRKTVDELRKRGDPYVRLTRWIISSLAKLEKLAAQIDACTAALEFYKQKYFYEI